MKTKTIASLVLATTLSLGGLSYAVAANQDGMQNGQNNAQDCSMVKEDGRGKHQGGKHKGKGKGKNKQMGFAKLDLTDQQKADMKTIMSAQKAEKKEQKTDADRLAQRAEMQALMSAETFDEAKAKSLIDAQEAQKSERKLSMLKAKHEMFQLLTDEQKAEFAEMQMKRQNR
ncbi:hypothetical protein GCM10007916_17130 [Psychromonas marina]|uniref:Periplasmic heavy metal sensor n=1 Tax=Psychromonas marina TaxID=88364 RepID=A0ABQ6E0W4_9GAMM|nr:Spy/CpxP family protein refolding chaperone [Psychromonas marina]GLS90646.1 hypothetical protein GCM10007916_17130 [Psychromonas marina]